MRGLSLRDPALVGALSTVAFNPLSLTPEVYLPAGGTYWQNSGLTTPATADSDPVGAWVNTGSGANALQATSGMRGLLRTGANGLNSVPIIQMDGTDDTLSVTLNSAAAQTVFAVIKKRSAASTATNAALALHVTSGSNMQYLTDTDLATGYGYFPNQAVGTTTLNGTPTNWNIVSITWASTSSCVARLNGGAGVTLDPDNAYAGATQLWLGSNETFNPGDYNIAEVFFKTAALTLGQHDSLGNFMATKFALSWTAVS